MKFLKHTIPLLLISALLLSCSKDRDDELRPTSSLDIKEFIWKGMNAFYLYKSDVPDLADNRFPGTGVFNNFLNTFDSPEALYDAIQAPQDRFSFMTNDYRTLEKLFSGVSTSNGMEFGLKKYKDGSGNVYGNVRLVLPGTDAENKNVKRGMVFNTINGQQITETNFRELIGLNEYTIGLATLNNDVITPTGVSISLSKREYTENPIFIEKILDVGSSKVGYLMYNSFVADFDLQLNTVFGKFKGAGITDLVLDLRYNGGGSVRTAIDLSAMITGQFKGEVFSTENWNDQIQLQFQASNPDRLVNLFNDKLRDDRNAINSLNLSKVYILTSGSSASASELVINGLNPYIDVIQIGDTTTGKFQASITLYDSPDFGKARANKNHFYAIQPLVLKSANKLGFTDFVDGLTPDFEAIEDLNNLGILGDSEEPLLKAALDMITTGKKPAAGKSAFAAAESVGESRMLLPNYQRMYNDVF